MVTRLLIVLFVLFTAYVAKIFFTNLYDHLCKLTVHRSTSFYLCI